nr:unnamed protein product [Digitaria exilis]
MAVRRPVAFCQRFATNPVALYQRLNPVAFYQRLVA